MTAPVESATLMNRYLAAGGGAGALLGVIGGLLLREDRDFHMIQVVEAGFRQYSIARRLSRGERLDEEA